MCAADHWIGGACDGLTLIARRIQRIPLHPTDRSTMSSVNQQCPACVAQMYAGLLFLRPDRLRRFWIDENLTAVWPRLNYRFACLIVEMAADQAGRKTP